MAKADGCQHRLADGAARESVTVGGVTFEGDVPCERCELCGEEFSLLRDLAAFELRAADAALRLGLRGPEIMRFARKALGLTRSELAELIGTDVDRVWHVETSADGAAPQERAALVAAVRSKLAGDPAGVLGAMREAAAWASWRRDGAAVEVPAVDRPPSPGAYAHVGADGSLRLTPEVMADVGLPPGGGGVVVLRRAGRPYAEILTNADFLALLNDPGATA